ncbi:MAG TPA: hypothetical protein PL029_02700 [Bacteroidia bacterium]|nr:hypothetical protein [Bacteroidia bacterium]
MKNYIISFVALVLFLNTGFSGRAQTAFHKYALTVSITGGSTRAVYSTKNNRPSDLSVRDHRQNMDGIVDPLILEFGISDRFGIGFTAGADIYKIDAKKFYNYDAQYESGKLPAYAHYFTFDFNYHPYVDRKIDLSYSAGIGTLKVNVFDCPAEQAAALDAESAENNEIASSGGDIQKYNQYVARGPMLRAGVKLRYYFWRRLGIMGMVTGFTGKANTLNKSDNNFGKDYSTSISGVATELGICFRFF